MRALRLAALIPLVALGCGEDTEQTSADQTEGKATLEIHARDIWAQPLPEDFVLEVRSGNQVIAGARVDDHVVRIPLTNAASFDITLKAPEHHDLSIKVRFDGTPLPGGLRLERGDQSEPHGTSIAHVPGANGKLVHQVHLGLRHRWFAASGRPARHGNYVDFLMDGEEAFTRLHADLVNAKDRVDVSTWWWESNLELIRPASLHTTMTAAQRKPNTVMAVMDAIPATKRVLVGHLWGQDGVLSGFTADDDIVARGETKNDRFEYMGQSNPTSGKFRFEVSPFLYGDRVRGAVSTLEGAAFGNEAEVKSTIAPYDVDLTQWPISLDVEHASYHQKFAVIDHEVAFVGGMNLRNGDWDTSKHLVFDPRRMEFDATADARAAVAAKESLPDKGPRKDYIARVEGPAAQDVADLFHDRWAHQLGQKVEFSENASDFEVVRDIGAREGGVQAQITTTMPQPFWEHSIAETWFNAVAQAEDYIFIEDQYFRAPLLNEAIAKRMAEVPSLKLVVITKPVDEWVDPGCRWTYESAQFFSQSFGDRFLFLQLRAFDTQVTWGFDETDAHFVNVDVHSKLFIVDDRFLSVGSANKNNRGMIYEAEMNVAVLDDAWVRTARRRVLANILPSGTTPKDDPAAWFDQLAKAAEYNDGVWGMWDAEGMDLDLGDGPLPAGYRPAGLLYSLYFGPVADCLLESVGPDMTGQEPGDEGPSYDGEGSDVE